MTAAPQLSLTLRDARWLPMLSMNGATGALGMDAEEVLEQLDLGNLIAFNIAVEIGGKTERRFLTRSLANCQARLDNPKIPRCDLFPGSQRMESDTEQQLRWLRIFKCIIRHDKPMIRGTEIDAALNCDPDHRLHLINAGHLRMLPGTQFRPGRNGAPAVTRASFEQFLKGRML